MNIAITQTTNSRLEDIDFNNIPLGHTFTDHMFICDYTEGQWQNPRVEPLTLIPTHPAAMALHYGQAIFEGMKSTLSQKREPLLFRPSENAKRLNESARRMGMPDFPEDLFVEGLKALVDVEKGWIPPADGSALYLRPFMYADEPFIGMRAATSFKFIVIALWLDAKEHTYIQEVGTMNIFFKIGGKFITPELDGSVLHGITRKSVMDVLKHKGYEVTERKITLQEIVEASQNGSLEEAFGTGTAVGIAYIQEIGWGDMVIPVSETYTVGEAVNGMLNDIKTGGEDPFGWMLTV